MPATVAVAAVTSHHRRRRPAAHAAALAALCLAALACTAGAAPPATALSFACPQVLNNTCQEAAELLRTLTKVNLTVCCGSCVDDPQCAGYTLNHRDGRCYLHANWVNSTRNGDCTSGHIRTPPTPPKGALNVFLIIVDDLRPQMLGPYGQSQMYTPNLKALMNRSTVFNRAYCQQAICGPTRNSFLSGRRPQRTQSWNFIDDFREVGPEWQSFPGYFKNQGYTTLGSGKTYHPGIPPNSDGVKSWSQDMPYKDSPDGLWNLPANVPRGSSSVQPDAMPAGNLSHYTDGKNLLTILDDLHYARNKSAPFFLAYGIHRPHLPFHFPVEFWDKYPRTEDIDLPLHQEAPAGMPPIAFTYEMDGASAIHTFGVKHPIPFPHKDPLPPNATRTMRRGYYSAVSWTDHLVGLAMAELAALGHLNDTIVALIGDHGWQLGEHSIWGKHTNFELGARVPLIISVPGKAARVVDDLVESVDLYPTIAALAGLEPPPDLDGVDLSPLVLGTGAVNKTVAFSEYPRCPRNVAEPWTDTTSCIRTRKTDFTVMGYSVRTDAYRYTVWLPWDGANLVGNFSAAPVGVELYTHLGDSEADFDAFENTNLATVPAYAEIVAEHHALAVTQWSKPGRH